MDYLLNPKLWSFLILVVNILLAITVVFWERKKPTSVWAWILILFFLPYLGFILYIIFGKPLRKKHLKRWIPQKSIGIQQMIDEQKEKATTSSLHVENIEQAHQLIHMNLATNDAIVTKNNDIHLFHDGDDKFNQLIEDIKNAKDHIHIQYYIFKLDGLGKRILDAATERAKAGVEVRILYDELGSRSTKKRHFKELIEAGGEVEVFFPSILPVINLRLNYRNHRKIVVIDGTIAYLGGFNVGDEYISLDRKFGYWRDTHMRIQGHAVYALQARFMADWNQAGNSLQLEYEDHYFPTPVVTGTTAMQIVSSGPDTKYKSILDTYVKMILQAKKYVYIQSPYFIPDESFLSAIKIALHSGVDVRIMIPNMPDHPFVYRATCSFAGECMLEGAKVYHYAKGFLHGKVMIIDDQIASVGTANIDNRSFELNFEVNGLIYDTKIATELADVFMEDMKQCTEMTKETHQQRSLWLRFKESISRLLAPIL
ncbi:cardiolipin synthase [Kurthia senegalensis]|uniref:cardiolipin synthase n=1 Tax=Kurthia senegalensis TaxID=1033740 RepID=UPI00028A134E|nr:cardiolipin synthase [Kurthia senegalensis]